MQLATILLLMSLGHALGAPSAYSGDLNTRDMTDAAASDEDHAEIQARSQPEDSATMEVQPEIVARAEPEDSADAPPVQTRELDDSGIPQDSDASIQAREVDENSSSTDGFVVVKRGGGYNNNNNNYNYNKNKGVGGLPKVKIANDGKAASTPPKKFPKPVQAAKPTGNLHKDLHDTNVIAKNHRAEDGRILKTAITANRKDAKLYPHDAKADHLANEKWRSFAKQDRKNDIASIKKGTQKIEKFDRKYPGGKGNNYQPDSYGHGGGYGGGGHGNGYKGNTYNGGGGYGKGGGGYGKGVGGHGW